MTVVGTYVVVEVYQIRQNSVAPFILSDVCKLTIVEAVIVVVVSPGDVTVATVVVEVTVVMVAVTSLRAVAVPWSEATVTLVCSSV